MCSVRTLRRSRLMPVSVLLLGAGAVAHDARAQAVDPWTPAAYFARSDDPPPAELPSRNRWPDRDDYSAWLDDADLERWVTQAKAGRAQAAINAGDYWQLRSSLARGNCAKALDWYRL